MNYFAWQNRFPAEGYATQLLHELGVKEFPIDIKTVITALGLKYAERDFGVDRVYGWLHRDTPATIYINSRIKSLERRTFTAAHEVGHWVIKGHDQPEYQCSPFDIESSFSNTAQRAEKEANRFATELLMPEKYIRDFLNRRDFNFLTISEVASRFRTSLTASALRVVEVSPEQCAIVLSHNKKILWSIESRSFKFTINRGMIHEHSYAIDLYIGDKQTQKDFEQVHPRAWLSDRQLPNDIEIEEYSHHYPDLGIVLSLIRIPPQQDEELYEG